MTKGYVIMGDVVNDRRLEKIQIILDKYNAQAVNPEFSAKDWVNESYDIDEVEEWVSSGITSPFVAAVYRDCGLSPSIIRLVIERILSWGKQYNSVDEFLRDICTGQINAEMIATIADYYNY